MTKSLELLINDLEEETKSSYDSIKLMNNLCDIEGAKKELLEKWKLVFTESKTEIENNDFIATTQIKSDDKSENCVFDLLTLHFLMNNERDIVDSLLKDIENEYNPKDLIENYDEMLKIEFNIKMGNYEPLKMFIFKNERYFMDNKNLVFYLNTHAFINLILKGKRVEALIFASSFYFEYLNIQYREKETKRLLTLLVGRKQNELELLLNNYRKKINIQFRSDLSLINGIPKRNPVDQIVCAGIKAVDLTNKKSNTNEKSLFSNEDFGEEIPVDLPVKYRYHSIFICPVLKKFCGEDNPPIMLPCGHVISSEAVKKISKGGEVITFKCPYCPRDCLVSKIRMLKL